jgi:glycosyltransferase involved in cell wall biosynthesis
MSNLKTNSFPRVGVVTVAYNCVDLIENTILSVIEKHNQNIEYIIIDGASTDGTVDIIRKYEAKIDFWISEPDKGIYDAMNKGIALSKADWIININAGDVLMEIPFDQLAALKRANYDAFCGCVVLDNKKIIKPIFNWKIKIFNTLPHQGLFYHRQSLYGQYNTFYKVYADYVYNIGMFKKNQKVFLSDQVISFHSTDGVSNNKSSSKEFYKIVMDESGCLFYIISYVYFKIQGMKLRLINLFKK